MLLLVLASLLASGLGLGRLGGWEEQDPSLVKWKNMLENDLDTNLKLVKIKNIPYTITHVTSQLVSGMNYKFDLIVSGNKCELTYYVQPWTDTHQITQDTCGIKVTHRRDNVGGWENVDDLSDPGLQECLGQSLDRVNQEINSYFRTVETSILSAQKKIVAGALYRVKFNAAPSNKCTNSERFLGKTSTDCPVSPDNQIQESEWQASCSYQAWMNPSTIVKNVTMTDDKKIVEENTKKLVSILNKDHISVVALNGENQKQDAVDHVIHKQRTLLSKEPSFNLIETGIKLFGGDQKKLIDSGKKLLGGDGHDLIEHAKTLFGKDGHDLIEHGKKLLGGDDHDFIEHGKTLLGGDSHDMVPHGNKQLGGDGHDMVPHGNKLLGGDGHDLVPHGNKLLGGDGHDMVPHGNKLLGGDGHDMVPHGNKLLGGDGHDMVPHGNKLLGRDGHDMVPHGNKLLGGDGHDMVPHGNKQLGGDGHDMVPHGNKQLGGDGHDLVPHGNKLLGGDGHDLVPHGNKLLGGDGHDMVPHGNKLLGGDGHDLAPHGNKLLGGDGHDMVPHGNKLLGGDGHDMVPQGNKLLGGDGHDLVPHKLQDKVVNVQQVSRQVLGKDGHDNVQHGNRTKLLGGDGHDYCHIGMFRDFQKKHNKMYRSQKEEQKRFMTFCDNMRKARKLQETEKGTAVYGATKFADLTKAEFKQYVGKRWDQSANRWMKRADIPKGQAPAQFDWRDHGAVTPVKNQGSCGSCWAFSTTGNIEGQWAIKKKQLISLSEQELVDCDKLDEGCNGGLPSNAYKEIERLGGLETESEYSYKGKDESCEFVKKDVKVYINDSVSISQNETEMASWLAANGPISIGINAFAMQFYMGGISHPWKIFCNPKSLDHGVLIVGYGVEGSEPYWIVKNSWGPDWGEQGYYRVYRGAGVCGLNTMCTSAVVN